MDIEWQEGAVCFADGCQWFSEGSDTFVNNKGGFMCAADLIEFKYFQLNTIKQSDYIEASELDTEKKYNDAVEVFGMFGFKFENNNARVTSFEHMITPSSKYLGIEPDGFIFSYQSNINDNARKLTFPQLMAIGELKRLELERGKSAPKIAPDLTPDLTPDLVQNPSHYQFFEGVEVIEIIASSMTREQFKGYCLGNRIKYRLRAGNKDKLEQEIAKSDKYVELYDEHKHLCK